LTLAVAALVGLLGMSPCLSQGQNPRQVPDFGLMMHDDGDNSFQSAEPSEAIARIRADMEQVSATDVRTYVYCIGTGVLYYPSRAGSPIGWRRLPSDDKPQWGRVERARAGFARDADPIRAAGEALKARGRYFILSHRMNDSHFMGAPEASPLTERFWLEHRELAIGEARSPIKARPNYGRLLDFTHADVRAHTLGIITEAVERYQDVIDGFHLDFSRTPFLFPRDTGAERKGLITELVAGVRRRLDELAARNGRPYYLFVQVPPSLRNALWAGLDVKQWIGRDLVDVVMPSQLMTIAPDMPVDEFAAIAHGKGVKVYPAVHSRKPIGWPFSAAGPAADLKGTEKFMPDAAYVYGTARNYLARGADGFLLYNWAARSWLRAPWFADMAAKLSSKTFAADDPLVYGASHAFYFDSEDSYEYRKPLPKVLQAGATAKVPVEIGGDVDCRVSLCLLRIGLSEGDRRMTNVTVSVNGRPVAELVRERLARMGVMPAAPLSEGRRYAAAEFYAYIDLTDVMLRQGTNEVTVSSSGSPLVAEVLFGIFGAREPSGTRR
jgi:hypothetical protein